MDKPTIDRQGRGRNAGKPWEVPPQGWKDTLRRTQQQIGKDNVSLLAAGSAFYSLLAMFPAIAALVAIWGLIAEPTEVVRQIDGFTALLPTDAATIINDQAQSAASAGGGAVITAVIGILFALWSASKGINAMIQALNIVYNEEERRGFLQQIKLRFVLTAVAVIGVAVAAALVIIVPATLEALPLPGHFEFLIGLVKWLVLAAGALVGFGILYRYAPCRADARWVWVTPGSIFGVALWLAGSAAFSVYVSNFANYNATYGTLGAVVILLMWLLLTCFTVLLGAELNMELERQTRKDTTTGPAQPIGDRGAYAADTVAKTRD
jgi:membrane protein